MSFTQEINRLLVMILAGFGFVAISAAYWAITGPDTILGREDNPRLFEAEARILRGSIYDAYDVLLAESIPDAGGFARRIYPHPETSSVLGYFSLRYGVGGVEAAYNTLLRGDDQPINFEQQFNQSVLHQPRQGADIRLTLDHELQRAIVQAMGDAVGAAVVINVPDGSILALVSLPSYDPNDLDTRWDTLIQAQNNPFFNRVLQGRYQPGTALQTPLMAALLLTNRSADTVAADASATVRVDDLSLRCALQPPTSDLSFRDAYAHACPRPFVQFALQLGDDRMNEILRAFHLTNPITLPNFTFADGNNTSREIVPPAGETTLETALGQGQLTVNPLNLALVAASTINGGNAVQPRLLQAVRPQGASDWVREPRTRAPFAFTTTDTTRRLRDLMVYNASQYPGLESDHTIGGHASIAYSGDTTHVWFLGFIQTDDNQNIAAAIVIEQTDDVEKAIAVGNTALNSAVR